MEDFTRRKLRDIELLVRISDVSGTSVHLLIEDSDNSLNSEDVRAENESLKHVDLSSLNFIVLALFVPQSIYK